MVSLSGPLLSIGGSRVRCSEVQQIPSESPPLPCLRHSWLSPLTTCPFSQFPSARFARDAGSRHVTLPFAEQRGANSLTLHENNYALAYKFHNFLLLILCRAVSCRGRPARAITSCVGFNVKLRSVKAASSEGSYFSSPPNHGPLIPALLLSLSNFCCAAKAWQVTIPDGRLPGGTTGRSQLQDGSLVFFL